jgi:hypothetical protein
MMIGCAADEAACAGSQEHHLLGDVLEVTPAGNWNTRPIGALQTRMSIVFGANRADATHRSMSAFAPMFTEIAVALLSLRALIFAAAVSQAACLL